MMMLPFSPFLLSTGQRRSRDVKRNKNPALFFFYLLLFHLISLHPPTFTGGLTNWLQVESIQWLHWLQ